MGARDWMVDAVKRFTGLIPSDWALHTAEGVEQHAEKDVNKIQRGEATIMPSGFTLNYNRTIHCIAWSYLRPYVYICDGRKVEAFNTITSNSPPLPNNPNKGILKPPQPAFEILVNDDPLFEDPLSDIIVANEKNHEILIMGTQDGLISIWDPTFNEHSHEIIGQPKMLTSNHIFNDQTRIYNNQNSIGRRVVSEKTFTKFSYDRSNHTLYR